jgi:hypothetical protein
MEIIALKIALCDENLNLTTHKVNFDCQFIKEKLTLCDEKLNLTTHKAKKN